MTAQTPLLIDTAYTDAVYLTVLRDEAWRLADYWRGRSSSDVATYHYMALACVGLLDALAGHDLDFEEARRELDWALRNDRNNIPGMVEQKLRALAARGEKADA